MLADPARRKRLGLKDQLRSKPIVGTAIAVQDRYNEDAGGQLAAAIAYFGFLSLFPILLLGLSAVGFLLADEPGLQARATDALTRSVPGLGPVIGDNLTSLVNSRAATGIIGLLGVLLAGLRIVDSATVATSRIFRVEDDAGFVKQKLRSSGALVALGLLALLGAAAGAVVGIDFSGVVAFFIGLGGTVLSLVLDTALFLAAYRMLTAKRGPPWRELLPGALLAGIGWTALKIFGSTYLATQVSNAQGIYGSLAGVIGLMIYFYLAARLYVYGAEFSAVRYQIDDSLGGTPPPAARRRGDASPFDERVTGDRQAPRASATRSDRPQSSRPQAVSALSEQRGAPGEGNERGNGSEARTAPTPPPSRGWTSLRPALGLLIALGALVVASRLTPPGARR
ncbi:MAG: YihY/virulence factor BrkB family protein [Actinomycetota bacterium]|nr:YihY/virulence factor BrkB family protein [Actinomycetota bacterium]